MNNAINLKFHSCIRNHSPFKIEQIVTSRQCMTLYFDLLFIPQWSFINTVIVLNEITRNLSECIRAISHTYIWLYVKIWSFLAVRGVMKDHYGSFVWQLLFKKVWKKDNIGIFVFYAQRGDLNEYMKCMSHG